MSTGQIFFVAGIVGMICTAIVSVVLIKALKIQEKQLREHIWKEYQ
ncbi:MAG: hypothetical protein ACI4JC_02220 [Faecalibacterium sp.]